MPSQVQAQRPRRAGAVGFRSGTDTSAPCTPPAARPPSRRVRVLPVGVNVTAMRGSGLPLLPIVITMRAASAGSVVPASHTDPPPGTTSEKSGAGQWVSLPPASRGALPDMSMSRPVAVATSARARAMRTRMGPILRRDAAAQRESSTRSASTIIRISSSKVVCGFQPSSRCAFEKSPTRWSTSAGRTREGSMTTWSSIRSPA